jgi:SAM-dependent methyltransferase
LDLTYVASTFEAFDAPAESYDAVVFNLSLHHVEDLAAVVDKARRLLRPGGRVVCHEFAYDRLDEVTAAWLFQVQQLVLSGLAESTPEAGRGAEATAELRRDWTTRFAEHGLHGFDAMLSALEETFPRESFTWMPYLFVLAGNRIRNATEEREAAFLRFLKGMESHLIEVGGIQAVSFRFVGARRVGS